MVYALHKIKHYLLSNMFIFYLYHMALVYLINKPHVYGKLVKWFSLFLKYDFKIVYKPSRSHLMVDALNTHPIRLNLLKYLIKVLMLTMNHIDTTMCGSPNF
jgi:hypothetical protein